MNKTKITSFPVRRWALITGGGVLTASYLFVIFEFTQFSWDALADMDWNTLGAFLGGVFAPLAFLWFVIAFFFQSFEITQNTLALKLQADEMKSAVEQASRQTQSMAETAQYQREDMLLRTYETYMAMLASCAANIYAIFRVKEVNESNADRSWSATDLLVKLWGRFAAGEKEVFSSLTISPQHNGQNEVEKIAFLLSFVPDVRRHMIRFTEVYEEFSRRLSTLEPNGTFTHVIESGDIGRMYRAIKQNGLVGS